MIIKTKFRRLKIEKTIIYGTYVVNTCCSNGCLCSTTAGTSPGANTGTGTNTSTKAYPTA